MNSIRIRNAYGKWYEVWTRAVRIGPFAVHRRPFDEEYWSITHLQSGAAIRSNIPTKEQAIKVAKHIHGLKLPWGFTNPKKIPKKTHEKCLELLLTEGLVTT